MKGVGRYELELNLHRTDYPHAVSPSRAARIPGLILRHGRERAAPPNGITPPTHTSTSLYHPIIFNTSHSTMSLVKVGEMPSLFPCVVRSVSRQE